MLMIIFLLSYVGIKSVVWINQSVFSSFGISEKKLSLWIQLFSVLISFFCFWFSIFGMQVWFFMCCLVFLSPILTFWAKRWRNKQIPSRCLAAMDRLILSMKSGQSLRGAIQSVTQSESTWYKIFLMELQKSLELHSVVSTESRWFNKWANEVIEVEKSRVKIVEQMEAVRRGMKIELDFKKKMKRVSEGPRMQATFMSILFLILNLLCIRSATADQIKILIPGAWIMFLIGIVLSYVVMRLFRWKI